METINYLPDFKEYDVYEFEHIDDYRGFLALESYFQPEFDASLQNREYVRYLTTLLEENLSDLFKSYGWEGDGQIKFYALLPCFTESEECVCDEIFHVKQHNNGTSFIAVPKRLQLARTGKIRKFGSRFLLKK